MDTIERNEIRKLLRGEYIVGFDYADIIEILGDYIDPDAYDRFLYHNEEMSDAQLQAFADHVQFFSHFSELWV